MEQSPLVKLHIALKKVEKLKALDAHLKKEIINEQQTIEKLKQELAMKQKRFEQKRGHKADPGPMIERSNKVIKAVEDTMAKMIETALSAADSLDAQIAKVI